MVGISYKKRVDNIVFLETYTTYRDYQNNYEVIVPVESLVAYCIYKYCSTPFVSLKFVPVKKTDENEPAVYIRDKTLNYIVHVDDVPWQVAACRFPVVLCDDFVVTGLCAVTRHICKYRNCPIIAQEHEDGLLGFRHGCLQAPNETSIWTKFCEVDIMKTVKKILSIEEIKKVPLHLVRFENHLKKPVRVHNVYKIARDIQKENLNVEQKAKEELEQKELNVEQKAKEELEQKKNVEQQVKEDLQQKELNVEQQAKEDLDHKGNLNIEQQTKEELNEKENFNIEGQSKGGNEELVLREPGQESPGPSRVPKPRKWKSKKKKAVEVSSSTKIEDLNVSHQFAEGPFLTLADLILVPSYQMIIQSFGETVFEFLLPFTFKWYKNLTSIPLVETRIVSSNTMNFKGLSVHHEIKIPETENVSLYKFDPSRHNPKKRMFTKEDDVEAALNSITEGMELPITDNELENNINWDEIPEGINLGSGYVPDERVVRKSQQLQNLALAVMSIAKEGDFIVDFCCGTGHLGILLAYLMPKSTVVLLENKEQSLWRAREKAHRAGLKNVYFYQCNLDFFTRKFDVGIGLHACGNASDLILDKCLKAKAKFVLCPCCYGFLHASSRMEYPRSKKFASIPLEKYLCIAHGADQTHDDHPLTVRGARCMTIIDSDRCCLAEEMGYKVTLSRLKPVTCTPKNNLLIGVPIEDK